MIGVPAKPEAAAMHPSLSKARFEKELSHVTCELTDERSWTIFEREYPILDVGFESPKGNKIRIRFDCVNWNELPPSVTLHAWDGSFLTTVPPSSTGIFNGSAHPQTGHPFICMRGIREWHTHPSHNADRWEPFRSQAEYRLGEIVTQVWSAWVRAN